MKTVLLLQEYLPHYRVAIFNELSRHVDLTVVYSKGSKPEGVEFKIKFVEMVTLHWKFHKINLYKLACQFDIVLCMFDTGFLDYRLLSILPRKYKLIYWGTGVLFDENSRYDGNNDTHYALMNAMRRADATVFYCGYPVDKYTKLGIDKNKLFVAHNTVSVLPLVGNRIKDNLLFIGTLYKSKGVYELVENYLAAYLENKDIPNLTIVGDGSEKNSIQQFIVQNNLQQKIALEGGVYDEEKIRDYFESSIICISPNQAGLSVLKSMGYGVPFLTVRNAITGGELFNITDGVNGVLVNEMAQIKDVILNVAANKQKFEIMGVKAKKHYDSSRKVTDMVNGFLKAFEYVDKL